MALAAQLLTRSEAIVAADTQCHLGRENCNSRHIDLIRWKSYYFLLIGPCLESGLAPWVGSCDEEAMKAKILSLSNDNRNFLRAPPPGVTFEFDYNSVSATALALLAEDPQLEKMRYELVPKSVKEDEFWRNYFYRVNLIKQSVDLKDLESNNSSTSTKAKQSKMVKEQNNHQDSEEIVDNSGK